MRKVNPPVVETSLEREIPEEIIAHRAYEKWQQRGCPLWEDQSDWFSARAELEQESGIRHEPGVGDRAA